MTAPITVAAAEPLPDFQTLPDLIAAHARARPRVDRTGRAASSA